jgi:hypothetical protein
VNKDLQLIKEQSNTIFMKIENTKNKENELKVIEDKVNE